MHSNMCQNLKSALSLGVVGIRLIDAKQDRLCHFFNELTNVPSIKIIMCGCPIFCWYRRGDILLFFIVECGYRSTFVIEVNVDA